MYCIRHITNKSFCFFSHLKKIKNKKNKNKFFFLNFKKKVFAFSHTFSIKPISIYIFDKHYANKLQKLIRYSNEYYINVLVCTL